MTHIYYDICKSLRASFTKPRQLQTLSHGIYCMWGKALRIITCAQSPHFSPALQSVCCQPPHGGPKPFPLPLGSGAGVGAHHTVPAPLLPGTCWPHGQLHRDALLPPCFLSEQTAAPRSHFWQSKPELLLLGLRWWYFCVDLKPIPIRWTMVSSGAIKYNFNNI